MDTRRKHGRRRLWPAALVLGGVGLLGAAGVLAVRDPAPTAPLELAARSVEPAQPRGAASTVPDSTPARVQKANPVRVVIPAIGVSAAVIPLGLNPDRTLEVPTNYAETGWYADGPEPGELGGAVIVGHVDSKSGPAVFFRLRELRREDRIEVVLKDGSTVRFAVRSTMAVPKDNFPTKLVYNKKPRATVALITCGGVFDEATGHYRDNYLVFADLDESS